MADESGVRTNRLKMSWLDAGATMLFVGGVAAVATVVIAGQQQRARPEQPPPDTAAELYMPRLQAYPPPLTPSPTPVPLGEYYPIPTHVPVEVVSLQTAPESGILTMLQAELDAKDASALAARAPGGIFYSLDICSRDVTHAQLQAALQGLFDAGSQPLIQGYFRHLNVSMGYHSITVVITGIGRSCRQAGKGWPCTPSPAGRRSGSGWLPASRFIPVSDRHFHPLTGLDLALAATLVAAEGGYSVRPPTGRVALLARFG